MFHRILIPLDGSSLAEKVLPYAVDLARKLQAQLVLLTVLKPRFGVYHRNDYEFHSANTALEYLADLKASISDPALNNHLDSSQIEIEITQDKAIEDIPQVALELKADLIVMSTHGRGAMGRLVLGSNAANIIQHSSLPVIMLRPKELDAQAALEEALNVPSTPYSLFNWPVLLTLDGQPEAEVAFTPALELANQLHTRLNLLHVSLDSLHLDPAYITAQYGLAYTAQAILDKYEQTKAICGYLDKLQVEVLKQKVSCSKMVREGEPAKEIVDYAQKIQAEMIVMATHAPSKINQVWLGSIAEEVLRRSHKPVMMINSHLYTAKPEQLYTRALATA
jgi:nucleotide-binding universal stress UspA family protein